ncbi:NUDIX domain-containing protein [Candidatus Saccharibacteria bacterium]|nr:NUDIX domain-containing protein [Candidatus Saccharibacteria bacterium]
MKATVTCLDIDGNEYEIPVNKLQWRPSAYGVIIKDGKVLLSKQFGSKYDLPGGGVDLGELPENTTIREVKEETGIDVVSPKFLGLENSFFHAKHASENSYQSILIYYACDLSGGELSTDGFDEYEKAYADMAEWVSLDTIDTIEIASTVDFRPYIKQAAQL